jgi:hypothetical protein
MSMNYKYCAQNLSKSWLFAKNVINMCCQNFAIFSTKKCIFLYSGNGIDLELASFNKIRYSKFRIYLNNYLMLIKPFLQYSKTGTKADKSPHFSQQSIRTTSTIFIICYCMTLLRIKLATTSL